MKNGENTISGQISKTCIDTPLNMYRYTFEHVPVQVMVQPRPVPVQPRPVPVQPSRTEPVPVQVRAVPVQVVPTTPVFAVFAYLS